jgi:hypothetical protein
VRKLLGSGSREDRGETSGWRLLARAHLLLGALPWLALAADYRLGAAAALLLGHWPRMGLYNSLTDGPHDYAGPLRHAFLWLFVAALFGAPFWLALSVGLAGRPPDRWHLARIAFCVSGVVALCLLCRTDPGQLLLWLSED